MRRRAVYVRAEGKKHVHVTRISSTRRREAYMRCSLAHSHSIHPRRRRGGDAHVLHSAPPRASRVLGKRHFRFTSRVIECERSSRPDLGYRNLAYESCSLAHEANFLVWKSHVLRLSGRGLGCLLMMHCVFFTHHAPRRDFNSQ